MVKASVVITSPMGLHLGPASRLSTEAIRFGSTVKMQVGETVCNAKSMLNVLGARVRCGTSITLICEGPDEQEALDALLSLIRQFCEEEPENGEKV